MQLSVSLTTLDLRTALERGVKLKELEAQLLRRMKLPAADRTGNGPLYLLEQTAPQLADVVRQWMRGDGPQPAQKPKGGFPFVLAPASRGSMRVPAYIKQLAPSAGPAAVAVDASPAQIGAALRYACSLPYCLQTPVRMAHMHEQCLDQEFEFHAGDFLCELAVWCFQNRIPLVPLDMPQRPVVSEYQFLYNRMLADAQKEFARQAQHKKDAASLESLASSLAHQIFGSGFHLAVEREELISRSCYIASRLLDP
ncbi:MAG: hypothetical protein H6Q45_441 [Deltaproteobacteria bacterium]|nr:hypothetical protein [Deltaproteobacteria bacterium]